MKLSALWNLAFSIILAVVTQAQSRAWGSEAYSAEKFHQAQKAGQSTLLHFHADWCPTCKQQQKALKSLDEAGKLKDITVYTVDYDHEDALKKLLNVHQQSTLISYQGEVETGRKVGETDPAAIERFLAASFSKPGLQAQLDAMKTNSAHKLPPEKKKVMDEAIENLRASKLTQGALQVGGTLPDIKLDNYLGKSVRVKDLLKQGPVIVTFYRGGWCPYCNLQLRAFQAHLAEIKAAGGKLIAISPETPKNASETVGKDSLEFEVLSDPHNRVAKKMGLVFGIPPELKKIYQEFGIDLEKNQGNPDWELPIAATYVVNKSGKVTYSFLDVDYTHRADPVDVIKALGQ